MRQPCSASNSWTAGSRTARPFWPKASPQRPTPVLPKPCAITGMKRPWFGMMAKAMMEAGEYVRALGHIRAGLKANPGNAALADLAEACASLRQQGK